MFATPLFWYRVIEVDPRCKNHKVGEVFGVEHQNEDLVCWGYDKENGKFYPDAKLHKIGRSEKGANKADVRVWLDKQISKLSQEDST